MSSVNELITSQNNANIASQAHGYKGVKKAIDEYNKSLSVSEEKTKSLTTAISNSNVKLGNHLANLNGAKAGMGGYALSLATVTAKSIALNVATTALNMGISLLVSKGIEFLVTGINNYIHRAEIAREKSVELTDTWKTEEKSISDSISRYDELTKKLEDNTLSTEEVKSAKEELASIQDTLVSKYGQEALGIDLVNGKRDEEIKKLRELSKEKANAYVSENYSNIKADKEYLTEDFNINKDLGYGANGVSLDSSLGFEIEKLLKQYENIGIKSFDLGNGASILRLWSEGTREEVYNELNQLFADLTEAYGESNPLVNNFKETLSNSLSNFDTEAINKAKENVLKYAEASILSGENTRNIYSDAVDAVSEYNEAILSGDGIEEAKKNLDEVKSQVEESLGEGTLSQIDKADEVFDNLWNGIYEGSTNSSDSLDGFGNKTDLFGSFDSTDLGERLDHINTKFEEGTLSHKQYFDSLHDEIENFDASNFTDSLEDAQNAAAQLFTDSVQQSASGLSDLINKFNSGEIGISEYLEGYLAIGNTISTLTDELQENSAEWDKNGQAISNSQNKALDATQIKLQSAMATIEGYQDSIYSLEMMMSGAVEAGSDEFRAHANVIAQDLANIIKNGGEMANEIKNTLGTTTSEIAKSMSESVANQGLASQAIAANTNTAIADMATSIGELFDSLGQAISNFNVDLTFSKKSGSLIGAITGADPLELSFTASGKSLEAIGSFVSSFGKQLSSNLAPQMIEMPDFSLGLTGDGKNGTYLPSKDITKNYEKALDGIKDTAKEIKKEVKETFDFFERRVKVLDNALSLLDANLENVNGSFAKNKLIDAQIGLNSEKINNYTDAMVMYTQKANEALSKLPSDIASKIKNGAVSITDFTNSEEITKAISEYQKWADRISDCKQELAELREELEKLELSKFQNIVKDFEDIRGFHEGTNDILDAWKNYFEASGEFVGQGLFEAQKIQSENMLKLYEQEKEALVKQLNSALNSGRVEIGSEAWIEMSNHLTSLEESIANCKTQIEEFDTAINEINFKVFERVQDQFENLHSELDNLIELFDEFDKSGNNNGWSKEGISSLGLISQKYELARYQAETYAREIEELNQAYLDGKFSTLEYQDKLAELTQGQWSAIEAYREAEEAILSLNEARINEEIEGIELEIDKFKELIDAEREALEERQKLENYKETIANKTKNIESLERQISAMQMDSSASAIAKRKLLEEQLAEARQDLEKTEKEHAYDSKLEDLDKQLSAFEKEQNEEIEQLRQSLENKEQLIDNSLEQVKQNSAIIGEEIKNMAEYHGIAISDAIITSWQNGENAIASYGSVLSAGSSAFIGNIMGVENEVYQLQYQANATADSLAWMFATRADNLVGQLVNSYTNEQMLNYMTQALRDSLVNTLERGYDISGITSALDSITSGLSIVADQANRTAQAIRDAVGAKNEVKLAPKPTIYKHPTSGGGGTHISTSHMQAYASGTRSTKGNIIITDEEGYELKMPKLANGNYSILPEGSQVLTKKQTDMIYEWAKLNPDTFIPSGVRNMVHDLTYNQPQVVNRNTSPTLEFNGTLMHIDKVDSTNIKQMENIANKAVDRLVTKMSDGIRYRNF